MQAPDDVDLNIAYAKAQADSGHLLSAAAALEEIVSLVSERLPAHYSVDPVRDIQVFAPVYRGDVGIDASMVGGDGSRVECGDFHAPDAKPAGQIIEDEDTNETVEKIVAWLEERKLI